MDRNRLIVAGLIGLGLFFLAIGAILVDMSNMAYPTAPPAEVIASNNNLANVWGPAIAHFGILLFVGGLFWASVFMDTADPFVRLFLLILGFVALLLVLANSPAIFG
ncbi:MAG: hypothetical protein ACT4OI_08540 [Methanobacteriota archaeon]